MAAYCVHDELDKSEQYNMAQTTDQESTLVFEDPEYLQSTLSGLNLLRQNKQFCDVVLQVGNHEVHGHRAVLACSSPFLFDMFTAFAEGVHEFRYKLNGMFERDAFEKLVNYAYTGRLEITESQLRSVYLAASRLKMARVTRQCGLFLIDMLNPENCIGTRSIPGLSNDVELISKVDAYIQREMASIVKSKDLLSLPGIQVELLHKRQEEMNAMNEHHLCGMVVDWIKERVEEDALTLDLLTEKMHMLYVNSDNSLHDCNEIQSGDADDSEIIQDYKQMSQKMQTPVSKGKKKPVTPVPSKPRHILYSRSVSDELPLPNEAEEQEWKLIAFTNTGVHAHVAIAALGGRLARISVMFRLNNPKEQVEIPLVADNQDTYHLMPPMASARCAVGAADLNGQLLVCGGYDRGECLKTAQLYDPSTNLWRILLPMLHSRGRFDMTVVEDKAFAIGGSDGLKELASVECYDLTTNKWSPGPPLPMARSNLGVCTLNDKIFCIGGWNGQAGIRRCDMFDAKLGAWTEIAPLQQGRYQLGACALNDFVYAVGGCNTWNCLNVVERYDLITDSWSYMAPLHTARRGCGTAAYNGKLYVVGGGDGTQSLCSVEVFDPDTNTWSAGPNLTSCRANVSVAVVGNRLYAVGGFTGKKFLKTIEYLDSHTNEWTTFTPNGESSSNGQGDSNNLNGHVVSNDHNGDSSNHHNGNREANGIH